MGDGVSRKYGFLQDLFFVVVTVSYIPIVCSLADVWKSCSMYYIARSVLDRLPMGADPEKEQQEQARIRAAANLRRLDRRRDEESDSEDGSGRDPNKPRRADKQELALNQYESQIAMEVVAPEDIPVGFDG